MQKKLKLLFQDFNIGTELKKENLIQLLRRKGPISLRDIRKHFRSSGTKEDRKKFLQSTILECAVRSDKTFSLKAGF